MLYATFRLNMSKDRFEQILSTKIHECHLNHFLFCIVSRIKAARYKPIFFARAFLFAVKSQSRGKEKYFLRGHILSGSLKNSLIPIC